ncbi:iron chelate uptake ABC transporter family permease subunit [Actinoplanes utahensis]|uniref:iron chelate uptake ABC transporter family permease subunit n=1 Tax=Actinoplanes utahensis TaxID=1869 RepID=UPI001A4E2ECA|nr:iron chelate uptake ABC transporter family permease subunit [Actinoplanes utahensis]GIF29626.1 hypothetical protein Aut01nite_26120 [Actinoplanes utahensis]
MVGSAISAHGQAQTVVPRVPAGSLRSKVAGSALCTAGWHCSLSALETAVRISRGCLSRDGKHDQEKNRGQHAPDGHVAPYDGAEPAGDCCGIPGRFLACAPPASALGGALVVVTGELITRTAIDYQELPLGVLTTVVGGPGFFWLLRRIRARAGGWGRGLPR